MIARFRVLSVFPLPAHGILSVEGLLEGRIILPGSVWFVESQPERSVTIKDIALVGGRSPGDKMLTLAVLPPSFPPEDLVGSTLVSGRPQVAANTAG
jgi:hypothetical protein